MKAMPTVRSLLEAREFFKLNEIGTCLCVAKNRTQVVRDYDTAGVFFGENKDGRRTDGPLKGDLP